MPKAELTYTSTVFRGGYRVSGSAAVSSVGYMDYGSVNFIQTGGGLRTRARMWEAEIFGGDDDLERFVELINATLRAEGSAEQVSGIDSVQLIDVYSYLPVRVQKAPAPPPGELRYMMAFKVLPEDDGSGMPPFVAFFDFSASAQDPLNVCQNPIIERFDGEPREPFAKVTVYPSVSIGYYKTFMLVTFPNVYNKLPLLFWWSEKAIWEKVAWRHPPAEVNSFPTVVTTMSVQNSPATHLVWGCSKDGTLRCSEPLVDELIATKDRVRDLLSTEKDRNFLLPLYAGAAEAPSRAMCVFNGALFVFGEESCFIVDQLVTFEKGNVLLTPIFHVAPFQGGCLNQAALALAWNELYVGNKYGAIYTINRVKESGSYLTADLFLANGVLARDPSFDFREPKIVSLPAGFGVSTFVPLKSIKLFFDYDNGLLGAHFAWITQRAAPAKDGGEHHIISEINSALLGYRNDCGPESTGWSNLDPLDDASIISHPGLLAISQRLSLTHPAAKLFSNRPLWTPTSRQEWPGFLRPWRRFRWRHKYVSPFFTATPSATLYMYKSMHLALERIGSANIFLDITCVTDLSVSHKIVNYLVPALFLLDRDPLSSSCFSNMSAKNSFLLGIEGSFFQLTIEESLSQEEESGNDWNERADFILAGLLLWHKPTGVIPNEIALDPTQ